MGKKLFMFDLDNTLVKTNRANNESYKEAILNVTGKTLDFKKRRFTRVDLRKILPDLSDTQISEIVVEKENCYSRYIPGTILNKQLVKLLSVLKDDGCETILLTESCKERAVKLCDYYCLSQLFSKQYFKEDYPNGDKYMFLKQNSFISQSIVLFENESSEILRARKNGISEKSIVKVKF